MSANLMIELKSLKYEAETKKQIRASIVDYKNILLKIFLLKKFNYINVYNITYIRVCNVFWLDLISSYKGWRHLVGLPVHGQRTWTNAWSTYRSNLILREYQVTLVKQIYTTAKVNNKKLNLAYLAERVNRLWHIQWENEWKIARRRRKKALQQNFISYKVDIERLASGNVNTKKIRKNRKKQITERRNQFILGFDSGFTKYLFKYNTLTQGEENKKKKKVEIIFNEGSIHRKSTANIKSQSKIKQSLKLKNIALKKIKRKKSIWD